MDWTNSEAIRFVSAKVPSLQSASCIKYKAASTMESTLKHLFASFVDLTMKSQSEDELIFGIAASPNILFNSV